MASKPALPPQWPDPPKTPNPGQNPNPGTNPVPANIPIASNRADTLRRIDTKRMEPSELAILHAQYQIEHLPAAVELTDIGIELAALRSRLSDWLEDNGHIRPVDQ